MSLVTSRNSIFNSLVSDNGPAELNKLLVSSGYNDNSIVEVVSVEYHLTKKHLVVAFKHADGIGLLFITFTEDGTPSVSF